MPAVAPPSPPYLGPPKWHGGNDNKPIKRIVIHATAGAEPGVQGAARSTVDYSKHTDRPSSFHYCADARESVQYTYDSTVAYGDGRNTHELHYELCCSLENKGKGHWDQADHLAMLKIAARDVALLCLAYNVPITKLTWQRVRADDIGICGHNDVRLAFPSATTHWDPGPYFPWDAFIQMVKDEAHNRVSPPAGPRVATLNVKSFPEMPIKDVRHDVRKASHLADVILWQEIAPDAYKGVVASLSQHGLKTEHLDTECPISFRTDTWEKLAAGRLDTTSGLAKVSPNRVVTWVRLRHKQTGAVIVFVNTHMVSKAWSKGNVFMRAWRRHTWKRHFRKQQKLIGQFMKHNRTIIGGGDHNRSNMPPFTDSQKWISSAGIDDLYLIPGAGANVNIESHDTVTGFFSDHDMRRGFLTVTA